MAQSPTGKAVSKVGSTGGGRTYRAQRPRTYYAVLALVVILGLVSVIAARHSYKNGAVTTTTASALPQVNTTTYAALGFDFCGKLEPNLPAAPLASTSIEVIGNGVVKIAPTTAASAGSNSKLSLAAKGYAGLKLGATSISYPTSSTTNSAITYTNGETCPAGTPDAGKAGHVGASVWSSYASLMPTTYVNPALAHVRGGSIITASFVPSGSKVLRPNQESITQMLKYNAGSVTTTTMAGTTTTSSSSTTSTPSSSTSSSTTTTTTKQN